MSGLGHLFVIPTTEAGQQAADIADQAIGLYLEYMQEHCYDEESARAAAVAEIREGMSVDDTEIERQMREEQANG